MPLTNAAKQWLFCNLGSKYKGNGDINWTKMDGSTVSLTRTALFNLMNYGASMTSTANSSSPQGGGSRLGYRFAI